MPDTTNRPTPEQVLDEPTSGAASWALAALAEHGYVIVHAADVPAMMGSDIAAYQDGFNACRDLVFGVGQ